NCTPFNTLSLSFTTTQPPYHLSPLSLHDALPILLDLLTIRDKHGRIDGIKVCLVGDVLHSRVARSNIWGLLKLERATRECRTSRSEEHTSELQSRGHLVCRLLLEKKNHCGFGKSK